MLSICSNALSLSYAASCLFLLTKPHAAPRRASHFARKSMAHSRVQLGVLLPLTGDPAADSGSQSIAVYEGFNTIGRSDLQAASKQVSRKHISVHASSDGSFQIIVEGQNPVVVRTKTERHELTSQRKALLHIGDIIELLPGKYPFKLMALPHEISDTERIMEENSLSLKRKRQEIEDESLARALQAVEEERARDDIEHISEAEQKVDGNLGRQTRNQPTSRGKSKSDGQTCSKEYYAKTFQLLRVRGLSNWANAGCVGIQDVIKGDVLFALLSNYMIDLDWLLSACPLLKQIPRVMVVHGESGGSLERLKAGKPAGWLLHKPPLPLSYGTHHSKAMILIYPAGVRIIIHTANLIYVDWNNKTQGLWMQDFPYKTEADKAGSSPFEEDLVEYLEALKWNGCTVNIPHRGDVRINATFFRNFDYSSAQVRLIASVPGYHQGRSLNKWGHMKLRNILEQQCFAEEFLKSPLIYQFSSLGSLDEKWLAEFNSSTSAGHISQNTSLGLGSFQIIWPTVEDVRNSIEGYAAGNAVPSPLKNVEKEFLRKYWARWQADHTGRSRAMPHFKSYVRYNEQNLAWFLLTSSNLSKAAWGALQKNGSQLMIRSYELGVLFMPSLEVIGNDFSCTDDRIQEELGIPTSGMPISDSSSNGRKVRFVTTRYHDIEEEEQGNTIRFPVPYKLPPQSYDSGDVPWSWDRQYLLPDTYGELWPRAVKLYGTKES